MFASGSVVKPEPLSVTSGQDENLDMSGSVVKPDVIFAHESELDQWDSKPAAAPKKGRK